MSRRAQVMLDLMTDILADPDRTRRIVAAALVAEEELGNTGTSVGLRLDTARSVLSDALATGT